MDKYVSELIAQIHDLLHRIEGYEDAREATKPKLRFVDDEPRGKVLLFPTVERQATVLSDNGGEKEKTPDFEKPGEQEQGFVEFTEKEIQQMPQQFRKLFKVDKHTAHVRRKNGYYEIRIQINGYRITATAKLLETAKERFIKKLKEINKKGGLPKRKTEVLLIPYVTQWLETVKKPFVKENTYKMYTQILNAYLRPRFEKQAIKSLTQFELQEFINGFVHAGKNRSAEKIALLLSAVLEYAVDDGIIPRSPMKRVIVARYEEEHGQALTRAEEKILISAFENELNEYAQAYVFMLYTGIRRGELASVEVSNGWISVVTGKQRLGVKPKTRRIPICPMLKRHFAKIDLKAIKKISPGMLTKHIKDYLPSHHCHDLRHTFITRAQECGIKREIVSLWAGHAPDTSITSTVYTHLEQNEEYQIKEISLFLYKLK